MPPTVRKASYPPATQRKATDRSRRHSLTDQAPAGIEVDREITIKLDLDGLVPGRNP